MHLEEGDLGDEDCGQGARPHKLAWPRGCLPCSHIRLCRAALPEDSTLSSTGSLESSQSLCTSSTGGALTSQRMLSCSDRAEVWK